MFNIDTFHKVMAGVTAILATSFLLHIIKKLYTDGVFFG
jgi:hypothetical protein